MPRDRSKIVRMLSFWPTPNSAKTASNRLSHFHDKTPRNALPNSLQAVSSPDLFGLCISLSSYMKYNYFILGLTMRLPGAQGWTRRGRQLAVMLNRLFRFNQFARVFLRNFVNKSCQGSSIPFKKTYRSSVHEFAAKAKTRNPPCPHIWISLFGSRIPRPQFLQAHKP